MWKTVPSVRTADRIHCMCDYNCQVAVGLHHKQNAAARLLFAKLHDVNITQSTY